MVKKVVNYIGGGFLVILVVFSSFAGGELLGRALMLDKNRFLLLSDTIYENDHGEQILLTKGTEIYQLNIMGVKMNVLLLENINAEKAKPMGFVEPSYYVSPDNEKLFGK